MYQDQQIAHELQVESEAADAQRAASEQQERDSNQADAQGLIEPLAAALAKPGRYSWPKLPPLITDKKPAEGAYVEVRFYPAGETANDSPLFMDEDRHIVEVHGAGVLVSYPKLDAHSALEWAMELERRNGYPVSADAKTLMALEHVDISCEEPRYCEECEALLLPSNRAEYDSKRFCRSCESGGAQ